MGFGNVVPRKQGEYAKPTKEYELPEPGNEIAIIIAVVDIGTQWHPREQPINQWYEEMFIDFELPDQTDSEGNPIRVSKKYRKSLFETAALYKDLKGWLKGEIEYGQEFDFSSLLGRVCSVEISLNERQDGNTYANVGNISSVNARLANNLPTPTHPTVFYQIEDGAPPDTIPEYMRNKILLSREHAGDRAERENPPDPRNMRKVDPPKDGKKLFAWCSRMTEVKPEFGVTAFINQIGRDNEWSKRMVDWTGEMVDYAYNAAVAEFINNPARKPESPIRREQFAAPSGDGKTLGAPSGARRTPVDTSVDHDRPRTGTAFVGWLREMQAKHDINIGKYIQGWGKLQEYSDAISTWDAAQVDHGYTEAVRKLRAINPAIDVTGNAPKRAPSPEAPPATNNAPVDEPANVGAVEESASAGVDDADDDIPF